MDEDSTRNQGTHFSVPQQTHMDSKALGDVQGEDAEKTTRESLSSSETKGRNGPKTVTPCMIRVL